VVDFGHWGGCALTKDTSLKDAGARSGRCASIRCLRRDGTRGYCVVPSNGGARRTEWYSNLRTTRRSLPSGTESFKGNWRCTAGEERRKMWDLMGTSFRPTRRVPGRH